MIASHMEELLQLLVFAPCVGLGALLYKLVTWLYRYKLLRDARQAVADRLRTVGRLSESVREGSAIVTIPLSGFPYVVGIYVVSKKNPTKKEFRGSGTIIGGYIVLAKHEIDEVYPTLQDRTPPKYDVYARTFDGQFHLLTDMIELYTDAIAYKAPAGYKSGSIESIGRAQHAMVSSARETSNSSMGILKPDQETAFGFLSYSGSTLAGFSGGPYTNGAKILGIHLGGGNSGNYGYSASFIMSRLKLAIKQESSEMEAFERALTKAKKEDIEYHRGLDTTQVFVSGRFFEFENEEFDDWIDESDFLDWFFVSDPETDTMRFRQPTKSNKGKGHQQLRGGVRQYDGERYYTDEPDYVGESAQSDDFLEMSRPEASAGAALKKVIDCQAITIDAIQRSLMSLERDLNGLKERVVTSGDLSASIQNIERKLNETFDHRLQTSMTLLEQNLTKLITSGIEGRLSSESQPSTSTSGPQSGNSTCKEVVASVPLQTLGQSDKRWDGMDSDFAKLKKWRDSADTSSKDYLRMRDKFLTDMGLTPGQCQTLVVRLKNFVTKRRGQLAKKQKLITTE